LPHLGIPDHSFRLAGFHRISILFINNFFKIRVMSRKTVRVKVPYNKSDELISLGEKIVEKHEELGESSPLVSLNKMDVFGAKLGQAGQIRNESRKLRNQSESKMEEAKLNLGIAPGQTKETPDTVYNLMLRIRDQLLVTYQGNEEKLSEWGFNVVVGQAKTKATEA
jgi:hypothetical protein